MKLSRRPGKKKTEKVWENFKAGNSLIARSFSVIIPLDRGRRVYSARIEVNQSIPAMRVSFVNARVIPAVRLPLNHRRQSKLNSLLSCFAPKHRKSKLAVTPCLLIATPFVWSKRVQTWFFFRWTSTLLIKRRPHSNKLQTENRISTCPVTLHSQETFSRRRYHLIKICWNANTTEGSV